MSQEAMEFDVVIVGAGPAGLSAALRLKQLKAELSVCVVDKGSEVGAHIISGAIFETRALDELIPNWKELEAPLHTQVTKEQTLMLGQNRSWIIPTWTLPSQMHNQGNYIISLGNLCRWLAAQAEKLEVEIYPSFAASQVLFRDNGSVKGVLTGEMGLDKNAKPKSTYEPGIELHGKYTLFAEGCRGSLAEQLMQHFELRQGVDPQSYGLGIKELWEIDSAQHQAGLVTHTVGWPLAFGVYGGSFIYHLENNQVAIGLVIGLDYKNPYLHPFEEFQRLKTHPAIRPILSGGRRISYGARTINEGGWQSIPKVVFPGGALIGCAAGFLNVAKIKGCHTAMKTGMLAAEAISEAFQQGNSDELTNYHKNLRCSWVYDELYQARNVRPASARWGLLGGAFYGKMLRGKEPFTLYRSEADYQSLKPASKSKPITYPKPDNQVSFDRLSSVSLSNTAHEEDQPVHLQLKDATVPISVNLAQYDAPEQRYCPAGVYEIIKKQNIPHLQINAANCIHCKTCEIKDPTQNIVWTVPEGGSGPNYPNM